MFEFIVIFCLNGDVTKCERFELLTDNCVSALQYVQQTVPEEAIVKGLTCKRKVDMVLPPLKPTPDEAKSKETIET